jgi:reverse gyrase
VEASNLPPIVYMKSCPNCGSDITSTRLYNGLVCNLCLEDTNLDKINSLSDLIKYLIKSKNLKNLTKYNNIVEEFEEFNKIFNKVIGFPPLSIQRMWAIRAISGESFSIIEPPGTGKTTFGLVLSLYLAKKGEKSLMIFPTKTLVKQALDKLYQMGKKLEFSPNIVYYHTGISQNVKNEVLKSIESKTFDILLISSKFSMKYKNELRDSAYKLLFVDDVDSVMKSSKSAMSILEIIGYSPEEIQKYKRLISRGLFTKEDQESLKSISELDELRQAKLKNKIVIFSSATLSRGNPLVSSLVGFRAGSSTIFLRKVIDSYVKMPDNEEEMFILLKRILNKLGSGGLIFVPIDKGIEYAEKLESILSSEYRVASISSSTTKRIEEFKNGELDILIGVATHYGTLVRGIDIPWRISYSIFIGIPKFKFKIGKITNPLIMLRILSIASFINQEDKEIQHLVVKLRRKLKKLSPAAIVNLSRELREGKLQDETLLAAEEKVNSLLQNRDFINKLSKLNYFVITEDGFIEIPDYLTYIQASGRTSRIYGSDLTTGLSILFVDDERLFKLLIERLNLILDEVRWLSLDIDSNRIGNLELDNLVNEIKLERKKILETREKGEIHSISNKLKTALLVVESPTKAKTISKFFNRPSIRRLGNVIVYEAITPGKILLITATNGHIFDLTTNNIGVYGIVVDNGTKPSKFIPYYNTLKRCSNGHQFTEPNENLCPVCGARVIEDKRDLITVLQKLAIEVDEVLIGTDPDVEGEKIAWDVYLNLRPFNSNIKRAEFHEVTRRAVLEAINNPRELNLLLLESQIVRRIEDRWIGFKLSSKLQTEFWRSYCYQSGKMSKEECERENRNLSAGRVQTPVLGWVIKRYDDYKNNLTLYYVASIPNIPELSDIRVILPKQEGIRKGSKIILEINKVDIKVEELAPLPPYTTDTLLTDASTFYGLSASETMKIAQDLFEVGLITYHRTDSTRISSVGINIAEQYLSQRLGDGYTKLFKPRSWGEGGAHEAIRPTRQIDVEQLRMMIENEELELAKKLTNNHYKVYDLIFKRFITSHLIPIKLTKEVIYLNVKREDGSKLRTESEFMEIVTNIDLEGYEDKLSNKIYLPFKKIYPSIIRAINQLCNTLPCEFLGIITNSFKKSKYQLYTQGELVQEMKLKGIGRPSTYATIVSTLLKRRYVIEPRTSKKLIPTDLGIKVYEYLTTNKNYSELVSEERTRLLLQMMDSIEEGKEDYKQVLKRLYNEIQKIR